MKKYITITMVLMLILTGCSFKREKVKVGATAGAMTGVAYGVVATAVASDMRKESYLAMLLFTTLTSLFGFGVGAATGYVLDTQSQHDERIEEIKQSIEYTK